MFRRKSPNTVLVIDDEAGPREAIKMILQKRYNVITTADPKQAIDIVSSGNADVVMLDIKMPGIDGLALLKALKSAAVDIEVVLITAFPSTQSAIEAMQYGAYDYVIKPFDRDRIEEAVRKGVARRNKRKTEKNLASNLISEIFEKRSRKKMNPSA